MFQYAFWDLDDFGDTIGEGLGVKTGVLSDNLGVVNDGLGKDVPDDICDSVNFWLETIGLTLVGPFCKLLLLVE